MNTGLGIADIMAEVIATGLLVSLCTIQAPSGILTASGAPDGLYANVSGLVSIRCISAPESMKRIGAKEERTEPQITDLNSNHVLLEGYYATLEAGWRDGWRAVIDGASYDLQGVESDSQAQMTRLKVTLVTI